MNRSPRWKSSLEAYAHTELRELAFKTQTAINAALTLLRSESLREMPFSLVGSRDIVVPAEAVLFFQGAGLVFRERKLPYPEGTVRAIGYPTDFIEVRPPYTQVKEVEIKDGDDAT